MKIVLLALALGACATMEQEPAEQTPEDACGASRVAGLVGRAFTASLPEDARRISRARTVRTILPGDAVTMDYRADRLNIYVSDHAIVERIVCG